MKKLIIFASGEGTNAQAIIDYFRNHNQVQILEIICNNPQAGVIKRAEREEIPLKMIDRQLFKSKTFLESLTRKGPDLIVLAGFLWKIPESVVSAFPNQIINLHPALLPLYGGKGMYGIHVHEAVKAAGETESGITVHYVNAHYDKGNILLQARCPVLPQDNPEQIAERIHHLEHFYLPRAIDFLLSNN